MDFSVVLAVVDVSDGALVVAYALIVVVVVELVVVVVAVVAVAVAGGGAVATVSLGLPDLHLYVQYYPGKVQQEIRHQQVDTSSLKKPCHYTSYLSILTSNSWSYFSYRSLYL